MDHKLVVKVKHPDWGKGWYKVTVVNAPGKSDELLIGHLRTLHREITAVQITREYTV